ncbi:MAG: phosphoribosylformylglycinamidine synthase subunit PurQ [Acidobacteriota bacterium]
MKAAVVEFPGSNCDHDAFEWASRLFHIPTELVWHTETHLKGADLVILPGGFSYGDYLRCGAMAARAPVMDAVIEHAKSGGLVIGICNGFQILCEVGLLPGALLRNQGLAFLCQDVYLRCETSKSPFSRHVGKGTVLRLPIAHHDGNYFTDPKTLKRLQREERILFRYVNPNGDVNEAWNVNGSLDAIAGVLSEGRNVLGMMPHPERASEAVLGNEDGAAILRSALKTLEAAHA